MNINVVKECIARKCYCEPGILEYDIEPILYQTDEFLRYETLKKMDSDITSEILNGIFINGKTYGIKKILLDCDNNGIILVIDEPEYIQDTSTFKACQEELKTLKEEYKIELEKLTDNEAEYEETFDESLRNNLRNALTDDFLNELKEQLKIELREEITEEVLTEVFGPQNEIDEEGDEK